MVLCEVAGACCRGSSASYDIEHAPEYGGACSWFSTCWGQRLEVLSAESSSQLVHPAELELWMGMPQSRAISSDCNWKWSVLETCL